MTTAFALVKASLASSIRLGSSRGFLHTVYRCTKILEPFLAVMERRLVEPTRLQQLLKVLHRVFRFDLVDRFFCLRLFDVHGFFL